MKKGNPNLIKKRVSNLSSTDINFHKINTIMNQRLVGLLDYLTASVYFSKYNIKKVKNEKNLEQFFKSKIFAKKPFKIGNNYKLNFSNKNQQNKQLNIIVNFKNNKINFKKNKFTSPFILHSKKSHFLKNMVVFSKNIHSEERKEENIKKKYPKLKSISLNSSDFQNFTKNQIFLTPRISSYDSGVTVERNDKYTTTRDLNRNHKSLYDINFSNLYPFLLNDKGLKSSSTKLSLDYNKENEVVQWKKRLKLKLRNLYDRNAVESTKGEMSSYYKSNYNYKNSSNEVKNKSLRSLKTMRPNCYYNNLHLLKLSKIFKRNSYQNLDSS
jgi:hypothetical protein